MNSGDRGRFKVLQVRFEILCALILWQNRGSYLERNRHNDIVELALLERASHFDSIIAGNQTRHRGAQLNLAAPLLDIRSCAAVKVRKRHFGQPQSSALS